MQEEALSMVPFHERPEPEELEDYLPHYKDSDRDYSDVRLQLNWWLYDYRRKQEEDRGKQDGRELFEDADPSDPLVSGGRRGYDPTTFNSILKSIERRSSPS